MCYIHSVLPNHHVHAHENHKKRSSHFARLATDKWINDYVNEQCCRVWEETNLHEVHQVAMHPQKVTAWCVFWARGVIGPYILENDNSVAVTVNGERYWLIKTNFFWSQNDNMDLDNMWF